MTTICNGDTQANCDGITHTDCLVGRSSSSVFKICSGPYSRAPYMLITFYICRMRDEVGEQKKPISSLFFLSFGTKKHRQEEERLKWKMEPVSISQLCRKHFQVMERKRLNMSGRGRTLCTREPEMNFKRCSWVWTNSRRQWRTGKPGVLQSMRSQTVGHN